MSLPVYVLPAHYSRWCRMLTVGHERHVTACRASIGADWPIFLKTRLSSEDQVCTACDADTRIRIARGEDLTPYAEEIGVRAELHAEDLHTPDLTSEPTVQAAEEIFGAEPAVARAITPRERPERLEGAATEWGTEAP